MGVDTREPVGQIGPIIDRATTQAIDDPARPSGPGIPAGHWEVLKKFPQFTDDIGRFIAEDRDRG